MIRALQRQGLADVYGNADIPIYVLNVAYPLIPDELIAFCAGKEQVLVLEEGQPEYIEQGIQTALRRADVQTRVFGKDIMPMAGCLWYTSDAADVLLCVYLWWRCSLDTRVLL